MTGVQTCALPICTLTLRPAVTRQAASGLLLATEVADYLVHKGMPFRTAHEVSGKIARELFALLWAEPQSGDDAPDRLIDARGLRQISDTDAIGKLVDPVSKTLRAFEEAKSERISLQNTLNSTRLTNSKLRDELNAVEKRATALETECGRLREMMVVAQQSVEALEATKTEHHAELVARRTQIADLQRRVQEQGNDLQIIRDENRRITERAASADKRSVQLEGESQAAKQKAMLAEQERSSIQSALDKALAEYA